MVRPETRIISILNALLLQVDNYASNSPEQWSKLPARTQLGLTADLDSAPRPTIGISCEQITVTGHGTDSRAEALIVMMLWTNDAANPELAMHEFVADVVRAVQSDVTLGTALDDGYIFFMQANVADDFSGTSGDAVARVEFQADFRWTSAAP